MTEATTQTRTAKTNEIRPDQLVDRYAELHAQVNEAQAEMMVIKAQLIATGQTRKPPSGGRGGRPGARL